ncbi:MAG: outer membrane lipoprotein carrier protein LolA [Kiloniellales bacterium]|nr:outer membrane lipoprotein carrier protein LolA [Kiloniellales bacterium]
MTQFGCRIRALAFAACLFFPVSGAGPAVAAEAQLSPDDVSTVVRIERYLNSLLSMQARFVQVSSNGGFAEGEVFVLRPGNLRFDYDPPATALLIANGLTLLYYDKELKQASFIPLWETPLWFLAGEEVKFEEELEILGVEEDLGTISLKLRQSDSPQAGTLTLIFSDKPLALRKWEVLDQQGVLTQVSLINPEFGGAIDEDLFDYDDLEINRGQNPVTERK